MKIYRNYFIALALADR